MLYICLEIDILYECRTKLQLKWTVEMMLEIVMVGTFATLGAYSIWYFFKAQTYHPLSLDELALMWKSHKHKSGCNATHIETLLLKNNEVIGYKCSCGAKYYQKRLITQRADKFKTKLMPKVAQRFTGIQELTQSMNQIGITCAHIKKI